MVYKLLQKVMKKNSKNKISHKKYTELVGKKNFPLDPTVPPGTNFKNKNGIIKNLLFQKLTSVALIDSKAGSVRANHYHLTDWHYAYVLDGYIDYYWRPVKSKSKPQKKRYKKGSMFFTPPLLEHAMFFPVKTSFLTFAKNIREHTKHEKDLVRIELIRSTWDKTKKKHVISYVD